MRKCESADSINSEDPISAPLEPSVRSPLAPDAGIALEQQVQPLPRPSFRPPLFRCGPTSWPLNIHYLFFPTRDHRFFVEWKGPDLFSRCTSSEDVFTFLNFLFPGEPVIWLNTRLSIISRLSGEIVVDLPFTILRSNIYTESLRCFQLLFDSVLIHWISCWSRDTSFDQFVLELAIWPWQSPLQEEYTLEHREEDHLDQSLLEPEAFVQNIVGNF